MGRRQTPDFERPGPLDAREARIPSLESIPKAVGWSLVYLGLLLWLVTVGWTRVWWVPPDAPGLFAVLPWWWWVGLVLSLAGTIILVSRTSRVGFLALAGLLIAYIWLTPVLVEPNFRVLDAAWHFGTARTIVDTGSVTFTAEVYNSYLRWPGFFLFQAALLLLVPTLEPSFYLRIFALVVPLWFFLAMGGFLGTIIRHRLSWRWSLLMLVPVAFLAQFHFSPQALALAILPGALIVMMSHGHRVLILQGLTVVGLAVIHPLTAFFLAGFWVLWQTLRILRIPGADLQEGRDSRWEWGRSLLSRPLPWVLLVIGVTGIGYLAGTWGLDWLLWRLRPGFWLAGAGRLLYKGVHWESGVAITLTKWIFLFLIGPLLTWMLWKAWQRKGVDRTWVAILVSWIGAVGIFAYVIVSVFPTGFDDRVGMFLLLLLPIVVAFLILRTPLAQHRRLTSVGLSLALAFLVLVPPVTVSFPFADENYRIAPDSGFAMVEYIGQSAGSTKVQADSKLIVVGLRDDTFRYRSFKTTIDLEQPGWLLAFSDYGLTSATSPMGERASYEVVASDPDWARVYDNGRFEAYLRPSVGG